MRPFKSRPDAILAGGSGHPEPVFLLKNVLVKEQKILSSGKHIKLILHDEKFKYKKMSAILWHKAADY
ncbi:MAG: hypothetical protein EBR81_17765, partial [Proteobacteria bacterium]|nr:hypothetical protein [Pseudomonadota bacterium]